VVERDGTLRILITGHLGYVGPSVLRQLRRTFPDAVLVGLDTGYFGHIVTDVEALPESVLDMHYWADVRHVPPEALAGIQAVVHLAAISNDPMGKAFERVTLETNHLATVELARRARDAGVSRFVFASSCSLYGHAESSAVTERSPLNPLTAYATSKARAEEDLAALASTDFSVTCLRFATACGMSDRLRLDLVLNDFTAAAVASGKIRILSDGTPWRPLIHVRDMARAFAWAVDRRPEQGGSFLTVNVGSDQWNFRVRDLAEAVQKVVPGVEILTNPDAPPDRRSYRVDFSLFRHLAPEHQPEADLIGTVTELEQSLRRMGFRNGDFSRSAYIRLNVLATLRERGLLDDDLYWKGRIQPAGWARERTTG
jgi:nucleoside-diphosphate-sugar epimerase